MSCCSSQVSFRLTLAKTNVRASRPECRMANTQPKKNTLKLLTRRHELYQLKVDGRFFFGGEYLEKVAKIEIESFQKEFLDDIVSIASIRTTFENGIIDQINSNSHPSIRKFSVFVFGSETDGFKWSKKLNKMKWSKNARFHPFRCDIIIYSVHLKRDGAYINNKMYNFCISPCY